MSKIRESARGDEIHAGNKQGQLELLKKEKGRSRWLCYCGVCKRVQSVPIARLREGAKSCGRCAGDVARLTTRAMHAD